MAARKQLSYFGGSVDNRNNGQYEILMISDLNQELSASRA